MAKEVKLPTIKDFKKWNMSIIDKIEGKSINDVVWSEKSLFIFEILEEFMEDWKNEKKY